MPDLEQFQGYRVRALSSQPLSEADVDSLLAFFHSPNVGRAFTLSDWTVQGEVEILVELARSVTTDPRVRIAAIEMLRRRASDALKLSGHIQQATFRQVQTDGEGRTLVADTQVRKLVAQSVSNTMRMLQSGVSTTRVVQSAELIAKDGEHNDLDDSNDHCTQTHIPPAEVTSGGLATGDMLGGDLPDELDPIPGPEEEAEAEPRCDEADDLCQQAEAPC